MNPNKIGLDFETYSGCNLKVHGIPRYVKHPTFRVLLGGLFEDGWADPHELDFVQYFDRSRDTVADCINGKIVVAHNVPFEYMVLESLGLHRLPLRYEDSAIAARARGGSGDLARAAKQFLTLRKMEEGRDLIKLFSIPSKEQEEDGDLEFDQNLIVKHTALWGLYMKYCGIDAKTGLALNESLALSLKEQSYADITLEMNMRGWPVDREVVQEMYVRYLENQAAALSDFQLAHDAKDLNLNSFPQQQKWLEERGIKARSFDEKAVEKLIRQIEKRLAAIGSSDPAKVNQYTAVLDMLRTKQVLGGSSLKKLKVILDTMVEEADGTWRLKDQYFHIGAGQTWRTTGRGAQMQNLKRFDEHGPSDMLEVFDPDIHWTNDELANNLRQAFIASHQDGALIVGDFSSIESRGLAWQAQEDWKTDAYRSGLDLYKKQAALIYSTTYETVTKDQRQTGKVGELSCGYGAGAVAVQGFAAKMGVEMNEAEAQKLVYDWRDANPMTVKWWKRLDDAIHQCLSKDETFFVRMVHGFQYKFTTKDAPVSLQQQVAGARTLVVHMLDSEGSTVMTRYFHGAHETGRNVRYYKPSKKQSGALWTDRYKDPKTGQIRFYEIYGGKMAGILTQSLCREIFFERLRAIYQWAQVHSNIELIGQFHDEVVLDWWPAPAAIGLEEAKKELDSLMSVCRFKGLPMGAEVKHDYRYTK